MPPELGVDPRNGRGPPRGAREPVADEAAHVVAAVGLDGVPVLRVALLLLGLGQVHEDVVADLVALGEGQAGRVQALEDELRVVVRLEPDVDDGECLDRVAELLGGQARGPDAPEQVAVVLRDVGPLDEPARVALDDPPEGLLIVLDQLELELLHLVELVDEPLAANPVGGPPRALRGDVASLELRDECGQEYEDRRHALLAVYEHAAVHVGLGHYASEEVGSAPLPGDSLEVVEEALALLLPQS